MVKPGDPLLKYLTANWFNKVDAAVSRVNQVLGGTVDPHTAGQYILVVNHEAVAKQKYEAVALGTPKLDYNVALGPIHNDIAFNTKDLTDAEPHNWVVLQEPLPGRVGGTARALIYGLTWLDLYDNDPGDDVFLKVTNGSPDRVLPGGDGKGYIHHTSYDEYNDNYLALITIGIPTTTGIQDIRINGRTFQYTFDSVEWINWHTGTDCISS